MNSLTSQLSQQRQPAVSLTTEKPANKTPEAASSKAASTPTSTTKKENLKVVIRHLPADLEASFFYTLVNPWINNETITDTYFVPGRISKKKNKKAIDTRVYIYMKNSEYLQKFYAAFNNEILSEIEGEVRPVLEIAPYQGKLKPAKPSNLANTINEDPEFQQFIKEVQALEARKEDQQAKEAEEAEKENAAKAGKIVAVAGTGPILGVPAKDESIPSESPKVPTSESSTSENTTTGKETEKTKKARKKKEKSKDARDKKENVDGKKTRENKKAKETKNVQGKNKEEGTAQKSKEEGISQKEATLEKEKKKRTRKNRASKESTPESSSKDAKVKLGGKDTKEATSRSIAISSKNGALGKVSSKSTESGKSTPKGVDSGRSTPKPVESGRSTPKSVESSKGTSEPTDLRKSSMLNESGKSTPRKPSESTKPNPKKPKKAIDHTSSGSGNEEVDFIDNLLGESVKKIISEGKTTPKPNKLKNEGNNKQKKKKTIDSTIPTPTGPSFDKNSPVPKGPAAAKPVKNNNKRKIPNSNSGEVTPGDSQTPVTSLQSSAPKGPKAMLEGDETKKPKPMRRPKPRPARKPKPTCNPGDQKPDNSSNNNVPTGPRVSV
jgi:hypothetical protein